MTIEELQKGLSVPVSKEVYVYLDGVYLSHSYKYRDNSEFIRDLRRIFTTSRSRAWFVRTLEYLLNAELL